MLIGSQVVLFWIWKRETLPSFSRYLVGRGMSVEQSIHILSDPGKAFLCLSKIPYHQQPPFWIPYTSHTKTRTASCTCDTVAKRLLVK
ncbi:hypothetical protein BHE74_00026974 [Ensete ventricosum]|nr:hypothetical protein BHE74_00026974 [Ensete ventricosum]